MHKNVKNTTFPSLFDLLAPHSCRGCGRLGSVLCGRCKKYIITNHQNICPFCKKQKTAEKCQDCPDFPPVYIVGRRDGLIGDLIQDFKYHSTRSLAKPLAEVLDHTLPTIDGEVRIVPLPTIPRHIRKRGIDHTYLIAKELSQLRGPQYKVDKLIQRKNNTVQVGSDKNTRKAQASKAYQITNPNSISKSMTYFLLDDVWTTGASLTAATNLLKKSGINKIVIAVLALSE